MNELEKLRAKNEALKEQRLRLSDQLIDVLVEQAEDRHIVMRLLSRTFPDDKRCVTCSGQEAQHDPGCVWFAAFVRFEQRAVTVGQEPIQGGTIEQEVPA